MVEQQPATLLAVLVANSERTQEEIVDEFLRCAREHQEKATLTVRTLQRWMKGGVQTAPRPAQATSSQNLLGIPNDHAAVAPAATSDPDPSSGFHTSAQPSPREQ